MWHDGMGGWGMGFGLPGLLFWALLIVVVVVVIKYLFGGPKS